MKKKILLIDDDVVLQRIYKDRLVNEGLDLISSTTGQDGLLQAKNAKPDLILLDVMLPEGMNGFDVLEQLRRDPNLSHIPIIMLTNLDSEEKTAQSLGVVDYINKAATSLDLIMQKVKSVFSGSLQADPGQSYQKV